MNEEQLKKYLEDQLNNKQKNELEQEFSNELFLDEALEGLTNWKADTKNNFDDLKEDLEKSIDKVVENTIPKPSSVIRMPIFRIIAVAASIIGILFFSVNYLFEQRNQVEKIYASNFKLLTHPDGAVRSSEVEENNVDEDVKKAVYFYENENYKKAIVYYQKALEKQPNNEKNSLFLAVSYLANYQPEKAIEILTNVNIDEHNYLSDRNWYLALAYLKIKDIDNAKIYFKKLATSESFYTENAKEILEQLGEEVLTVQK